VAKTAVDVAALRARLANTFSTLDAFHPIAEGEESRAFAFSAAGSDFVARINSSATGFQKDNLAFTRFNSPALPVPKVLMLERFDAGWLCVSRRAAGVTLQALSQGGAFNYGAAVGSVLDAMSEHGWERDAKAGPVDPSGAGSFDTWPAFIGDVAHWQWPPFAGETGDVVTAAIADILTQVDDLPDRRQLVHGDFGSNNVLVKDDQITGVIDWSEAMIGDPDYDLANLLFWRPWLDCMEQQCRYFERHEPMRLSATGRLRCYQLHIGLKVLGDALLERDERMIDWSISRCRSLLAGG
jgi:hygromycin-B 4-O-kinase